jgi:hypothetical protein
MNPSQAENPKLLLVGAGESEIGRSARGGSGVDLRGAVLPWLLEPILAERGGNLLFGRRPYEVAEVRKFDQLALMGPPKKRFEPEGRDEQKARKALLLAEIRGLDGVVILIDRESKKQPDRAARLRQGRDSFRRDRAACGPACAIGASCRSVETWLLADPHARTSVFGQDAPDPFSGDPEDRPSPRELKRYIEAMAKGKGAELPDVYEGLAKAARPDELRSRCKTSYPPFADDVGKEIGPLIRPDDA